MTLKLLLDSGAIYSPYPLCLQQSTYNSSDLPPNSFCEKKCGAIPQCYALSNSATGFHTCHYGLGYAVTEVGSTKAVFYGLKFDGLAKPHDRAAKEALRGREANIEKINRWTINVKNLLDRVEEVIENRNRSSLQPLHDPLKLAKQIKVIAEEFLSSSGIKSQNDYEGASKEIKSLIKTSELLMGSFDLLEIYFNPAAAKFGGKSLISLHGLLHKLVAVLKIQDRNSKVVRIFLLGESRKNIHVYDSFKLLPFALLTNAIKYSLDGKIEVRIIESIRSVNVAFESSGPLIEQEEIGKIFERGFRGKWAKALSAEGYGIGLSLAKVVADAHGLIVRVTSAANGSKANNIPLAINRFSFELPLGLND